MAEKILIVGGTRYIGPLLLELLQKDQLQITVFNRGNREFNYEGIEHVIGDRNQGFAALKGKRFDVVYDMCAYIGLQTKRLLEEVDFNFLVHLGTVASYKAPSVFPVREDYPMGEWFWGDYGKGKAECEETLAKSKLKHAILRPTYILGATNYLDRESFIYSKLMAEETIYIPGDGLALNQFVFSDEVANSLYLLGSKKIEGAYNCVGDDYLTIIDLVNGMGEICGKKPKIKLDPKHDSGNQDESLFPFANENFVCSNEKIKKLGITFAPIFEHLKLDWEAGYSKNYQ